jgi:hypothetical protein
MDISKFYNCLTPAEKKQLSFLIKNDKVKSSNEMFVRDWVHHVDLSVRLINVLMGKWSKADKLVSDITAEEFFSIRNAGVKAWQEFQLLRGNETEI